MFNEKIDGVITSYSTKIKTLKDKSGVKNKVITSKFVLESANISYKEIHKFNTFIGQTLENIQPIPFKDINFGDQSAFMFPLLIHVYEEETNKLLKSYDLIKVSITNLSIKIKENIPVYKFVIEIPFQEYSDNISRLIEEKIKFEFKERM